MALGSCRRWCPAPAMIRRSAAPWAPATTRASNDGTISSSPPWTSRRSRGARADTARSADSSRSAPDHRPKSGGESDMVRRPASRACRAVGAGWPPSPTSRPARPVRHTPLIPSSTAAAQMAKRGPTTEPHDPHPLHAGLTPKVGSGGHHVVTPSVEAEIAVQILAFPAGTGPWPPNPSRWRSGRPTPEKWPPSWLRRLGPLGNPWQITTPGRAALPAPARSQSGGPHGRPASGHRTGTGGSRTRRPRSPWHRRAEDTPVSPAGGGCRGTHGPAARRPRR